MTEQLKKEEQVEDVKQEIKQEEVKVEASGSEVKSKTLQDLSATELKASIYDRQRIINNVSREIEVLTNRLSQLE